MLTPGLPPQFRGKQTVLKGYPRTGVVDSTPVEAWLVRPFKVGHVVDLYSHTSLPVRRALHTQCVPYREGWLVVYMVPEGEVQAGGERVKVAPPQSH